jgi:NAD(P)-dependent dehydrogenase (short-subunit alcohol dehydrogenase family)
MSRDFEGRVVVITGAGGGLGSALARRFAAAGARLALLDLQAPATLAAEVGGLAVACDVTDAAACEQAMAQVSDTLGPVDVLVNNAGITHRSLLQATDASVLRRVMDVNLFGTVHMTQSALPSLVAQRGLVIGLSSVAGFAPLVGRAGYVASKHAIEGFLATLRVELAGTGLDVLVVRPGFIDTGLQGRALDGRGERATHAQAAIGGRMSAEQAAERIVRAAARRQRTLELTPISKASWLLTRVSPRLYDAVMRRSQRSEMAPA